MPKPWSPLHRVTHLPEQFRLPRSAEATKQFEHPVPDGTPVLYIHWTGTIHGERRGSVLSSEKIGSRYYYVIQPDDGSEPYNVSDIGFEVRCYTC